MEKRILLSVIVASSLALGATNGDVKAMKTELKALKDRLSQSDAQMKAIQAELANLKNSNKKETTNEEASNATAIEKLSKKVSELKANTAGDNIKWSMDFRNSVDYINYKYDKYSYKDSTGKIVTLDGQEKNNDALITSRLYLNMKAQPHEKLTFHGQIAMYGIWGGESFGNYDPTSKVWNQSSKADDTLLRVRQAYFVYNDTLFNEKLPWSIGVGRRNSTDGIMANYRENKSEPGSPLAHITNMEVDGVTLKLDTDQYLTTGSYLKFIYGRAHAGGIKTLTDNAVGYQPYAQDGGDVNDNVNYFVAIASLYNDGQYNLMYQNSTIFNTKGQNLTTKATAVGAGTANFHALSLDVNGVGNGISDFLDNTNVFASIASTSSMPDAGHQLLGSKENQTGYSYWLGATVPDMITEKGKLGLEYNHGSKYWTPTTWAEDTVIGSKTAIRGDALEAYWNFNLFGMDNLTSQVRYTYLMHDYTPNIRCAGWVKPEKVDITATDLRFFVQYSY